MEPTSNLEGYKKFILDNVKEMPNPNPDILRISGLHSWYKHLGEFVKAYPLLMKGEEARYEWAPLFSDNNQENFHWTIIMEHHLNEYKILNENNQLVYLSKDLIEYMKKFPIYLNHDFGGYRETSKFFLLVCEKMCQEFWSSMQA